MLAMEKSDDESNLLADADEGEQMESTKPAPGNTSERPDSAVAKSSHSDAERKCRSEQKRHDKLSKGFDRLQELIFAANPGARASAEERMKRGKRGDKERGIFSCQELTHIAADALECAHQQNVTMRGLLAGGTSSGICCELAAPLPPPSARPPFPATLRKKL